MSEKYHDADTPQESKESSDAHDQPSEMTDVGKNAMRGVLDYSDDTQDAIASINEQPVENHKDLVAELQEKDPKAWEELRKLGGTTDEGIIGSDGNLLIPYSKEKPEESE